MSFEPVAAPDAHVLIVGTWPSPKSREQGFYYGHPQNRFWPLMAHLLSRPVPATVPEKRALIVENRLALWDTIAQCTVTGASDASIRDVVPNDIQGLCDRLPIRRILCNGALAYRLCTRFHALAGIEVIRLPSTSPANAAFSMQRLADAWGAALRE